jgi:hypothetical protein
MGNNPSVSFQTQVIAPSPGLNFLHRALFTVRPSTADFLAGFTASTQSWMRISPTTGLGLVAELGANNYASRLISLGATSADPAYIAIDAHFKQLAVASPNGSIPAIKKPDVVYLGRRTRAVNSAQTFTFGTIGAADTSVRIRVNPAKYLYSGETPAGAMADITVEADGVLTVTDLAADAVSQLNAITMFGANFLAANLLGVVTVTSLVDGYPLIIEVTATANGPTMTQAITTVNPAGDYALDLTDIQACAEYNTTGDNVPARLWFWITDLQGDDVVNDEGAEWAEDQADTAVYTPPRGYIFGEWSMTGNKSIKIGADFVGNFDPAATASASQTAQAANAGTGWTTSFVLDHDRLEFAVPALFGRCIGYLPGEVSFTDKVLFGSTDNAKMTARDYGDADSLTEERKFNFYGAEGPKGACQWGFLSDGSFIDRKWLEWYVTYLCSTRLVSWKQRNNITAYTDDSIEAGAGIIAAAIAELPAIDTSSIAVSFLGRAAVNPNDIATRVYKDYSAFAVSFGVINKIGTPADPIMVTVNDAG